jgi:hypothetical protein
MMYHDYTEKAFLTLFLSFCGYLPGLAVNLIMLFMAMGDRDQYGEAPGLGCLVGLLIFCGTPCQVLCNE